MSRSKEYKDKDAESKRNMYAYNPRKQKSASLKYKYGITLDEYDEMLLKQGGGCAICRATDPKGRGRFHVDHDHTCCPGQTTCGKCIRGLLCTSCNTKLGYLEQVIARSEWVNNAKGYLKLWKKK